MADQWSGKMARPDIRGSSRLRSVAQGRYPLVRITSRNGYDFMTLVLTFPVAASCCEASSLSWQRDFAPCLCRLTGWGGVEAGS